MRVEINDVTKLRLIEQMARMRASEASHVRVTEDVNERVTSLVEASVRSVEFDPDTLRGIDLNTVQEGYVTLQLEKKEETADETVLVQ